MGKTQKARGFPKLRPQLLSLWCNKPRGAQFTQTVIRLRGPAGSCPPRWGPSWLSQWGTLHGGGGHYCLRKRLLHGCESLLLSPVVQGNSSEPLTPCMELGVGFMKCGSSGAPASPAWAQASWRNTWLWKRRHCPRVTWRHQPREGRKGPAPELLPGTRSRPIECASHHRQLVL